MQQEVVDYITQARSHGLPDFEIKQNLLNVGWDAAMVEEGFVAIKAMETKAQGTPQTAKPITAVTPVLTPQEEQIKKEPVPAAPSVTTSSSNKGKFSGWKIVIPVVVITLALLAGAAYGYYNYWPVSSAKVLTKTLAAARPATYQTNIDFAYTDNNDKSGSSTAPVTISLGLSSQNDASDVNNLKSGGNINIGINTAGQSVSGSFNYVLLSKVLYLELGKVPELKAMFPAGQDWIKLDLDQLQNSMGQMASSTEQTQLKNQLIQIWQNANFITPIGNATREKLNGVAVYHAKGQLNSQNFSNAIMQSISAIEKSQNPSATTITDQEKNAIISFINKIQIKELDVWVGQKDFLPYKIHILSNAPSASDLSNSNLADTAGPLGDSREQARDAKRLGDIRSLSSALELYSNDKGGYPGGPTGTPEDISPTYINSFPSAPQPTDGSCTDYYNAYWYTPEGTPKTVNGTIVYPSYSLTFCLGQDTGGYKAGIAELTPEGITANITCPTTPAQCVAQPNTSNTDISQSINNMTFSASVQVDVTYSNYGQPENIQAPTTSIDTTNLLNPSALISPE